MDKRGVALIFALLFVVILAILSSSFYFKSINENNLVRIYIESIRALWLAECGVAEAVDNMPNDVSGFLGDTKYTWSADTSYMVDEYYQIDSTGSVSLSGGGSISRSISAVVRTDPVDDSNFQHAIRTTSDLVIKGSVEINGPQEEFASLNFSDLFEHSKEELKSYADHLYIDPPLNITPVNGITWVELSAGQEFKISSDTWTGEGILIVSGDARITGGIFNGIIYITGKLWMSGNPIINGTILVESDTEIDTELTGNVTINWDQSAIIGALGELEFVAPIIVSWREG